MLMGFTQKYVIAQLLRPVPEGVEYAWTDWPLHVTIADVFAVGWDVSTMIDKLEQLLGQAGGFTATAGGDRLFGAEHQIRVTLIDKNERLDGLHATVVSLLEQGGVVFNNPEFVREGFLPHATVQPKDRLSIGDTVKFDALTLIDMFPGEDPYKRKILKTIKIL
jgi:2'-5' RNA ligase